MYPTGLPTMAAVTMTAQQRMMKATDMVEAFTGDGEGQLAVSRTVEVPAELLVKLEAWLDLALQAFEGNPGPSEIEGKRIHADLLELTNSAGLT
jgi:hypothetical protein